MTENAGAIVPGEMLNNSENVNEMTQSYSEISMDSNESEKDDDMFIFQSFSKLSGPTSRPASLQIDGGSVAEQGLEFLEAAGTVEKQGDMVMFFSQDLENKIKLSSPAGVDKLCRQMTSLTLHERNLPPPLDATVLSCLETEARRVATAVDALTENLAGYLRSVSALTVDCLETHRDAVCSTCDALDANIKAMYQLMAKSEEISKTMAPVQRLADQIKEMKRLLDLYDNAINV